MCKVGRSVSEYRKIWASAVKTAFPMYADESFITFILTHAHNQKVYVQWVVLENPTLLRKARDLLEKRGFF